MTGLVADRDRGPSIPLDGDRELDVQATDATKKSCCIFILAALELALELHIVGFENGDLVLEVFDHGLLEAAVLLCKEKGFA